MKPKTLYRDAHGSVFFTGNVEPAESSAVYYAELVDWCWIPGGATYRNCGFNTREFPYTVAATLVEIDETEFKQIYKNNFLLHHDKIDFSKEQAFSINYNSRSPNSMIFISIIYDLLKQRKS